MADHHVARRRLAALEQAVDLLVKEWGETAGTGPFSHYSDMMAVDIADAVEQGDHLNPGVWITTSGLVQGMISLRDEYRGMCEHAEKFAMAHGPMQWGDR